jgi:twitching motility protein PilT
VLKTRSGIVVTVEDPVEYIQKHSYGIVKQRQLGLDTASFGAAIKGALRQDVNAICITEMRDLDSIRAALTAAETGHLMLTTLHTPDTVGTLDRIVDVFPPDQQHQIMTQLAGSLVAVICQKLLPRSDTPGRAMASEVLIANDAVRACIRDHKFHQVHGLIQIGGGIGMHTFDDSLMHLLRGDHISLETALDHAKDEVRVKSEFQDILRSRSRRA